MRPAAPIRAASRQTQTQAKPTISGWA